MKKYVVFIILILTLFLSGCWDRRELNQLAITLALGIDKVDDEYLVTAQVVVPSEMSMKGSSAGGTKVTLYSESGETVYEAIRKMTKNSPRKIYPGHFRLLILGEELAKEGLGETLDVLSRDWEIRPDFYVVIAKDTTATEILNITTALDDIPANKMYNSLSMSEKVWAGTRSVSLDELISDFISDGKEAVLTGVQLKGDPQIGSTKQNLESISPLTTIQYDTLAIFKRDQLLGWLTEKETIAFNYITDSVKSTVSPIFCPDGGKATIEVIQVNSNTKGDFKDGKPEVNVKINVKGNIGSVDCNINLKKLSTIEELEKIYEQKITENIYKMFDTAQKKYRVDIFGFGEILHQSNPKEWNKIKYNWEDEFSTLTMNVQVKLEINSTGSIINSYSEKIKN